MRESSILRTINNMIYDNYQFYCTYIQVRKPRIIEPIYILACDKCAMDIFYPLTRTNFVPPSKGPRMCTSIREIINSAKGLRRDPVYQEFIEKENLPDPDYGDAFEDDKAGTITYPEFKSVAISSNVLYSERGEYQRFTHKKCRQPRHVKLQSSEQATIKHSSESIKKMIRDLDKFDRGTKSPNLGCDDLKLKLDRKAFEQKEKSLLKLSSTKCFQRYSRASVS